MLMDYVLPYLIQKYIAGLDDLDPVREYVTGRIGVVDDELIDYVSMEIWHFEGGLLSEERLRARLAAILQETANYPIWFTNARDSITPFAAAPHLLPTIASPTLGRSTIGQRSPWGSIRLPNLGKVNDPHGNFRHSMPVEMNIKPIKARQVNLHL